MNRLTWRNLLLMQALGQLAIFADSLEEKLFGAWMGHQSLAYASMALNVCLVLPMTLIADAAVERGRKAGAVYTAAILMTLPLAGISTGLMEWVYVVVFGLPADKPNFFSRAAIETTFHMYIYGAFVMLVYFNQRTADRMLEHFRTAELRRARLENELVDSRLATAEAQIDPTLLFTRLGGIKRGFERADPSAEDELNELIKSLRAALARTAVVNGSEAPS